jgi:hypothetical protein
MAVQQVATQPWFLAFKDEDTRQRMRNAGRHLFGLAIQYMSRTKSHSPSLQEGRGIGEYFGCECAAQGVSLADTVRALYFFSQSLISASGLQPTAGRTFDSEDVRLHRQLRHFLDEVMYACLESYEVACRGK